MQYFIVNDTNTDDCVQSAPFRAVEADMHYTR